MKKANLLRRLAASALLASIGVGFSIAGISGAAVCCFALAILVSLPASRRS